jgi:hypothetical protein
MYGNSTRENREALPTPDPKVGAGRLEKVMSRKSNTNVGGESHGRVVPAKCPNKDGKPLAEGAEGRRPTKENTVQTTASQTQSWGDALSGLSRVREAGAAMLVGVPVGASPTGGACSVTTVVIPRPREGRPTRGKLGSKSLRWLGGMPGQIRQGGQQFDRP